jgi:hypothetical protein
MRSHSLARPQRWIRSFAVASQLSKGPEIFVNDTATAGADRVRYSCAHRNPVDDVLCGSYAEFPASRTNEDCLRQMQKARWDTNDPENLSCRLHGGQRQWRKPERTLTVIGVAGDALSPTEQFSRLDRLKVEIAGAFKDRMQIEQQFSDANQRLGDLIGLYAETAFEVGAL